MDTITIAGTCTFDRSEQARPSQHAMEPLASDIRTLEDWELVLAAGGDDAPAWI